MDYAFKIDEYEANKMITEYLRTITNIVDAKLKYNTEGCLITDTVDSKGKSFKRLREIKLLDYMSLLQLSLKYAGYDVGMIKQVFGNNEKGEEIPIFICYTNLIKRGR